MLSKDSTERNEIIRSVVNTAIDECIKENVLRDFFLKYRKEVVEVGVLGYSAEKHMKVISDESYDSGYRSGFANGEELGEQRGILGAVELLREAGIDDAAILERICEKFGLTSDQGKEFL